jgi:hypothetical protein
VTAGRCHRPAGVWRRGARNLSCARSRGSSADVPGRFQENAGTVPRATVVNANAADFAAIQQVEPFAFELP